jgi:ectoine hydroxylase
MSNINRITQQTPLSEAVFLLERDGYVLMEEALPPTLLTELQNGYDKQISQHPSPAGRIEIRRILERDSVFEALMDHPPTFALAHALLGYDIELASGGELDHKMPNTPAHIGWHNDFQWMTNVACPRTNFWVRCTFFLSDVTSEMGPFTLLPGTHRSTVPCPDNPRGADGEPAFMEGQIGITGPAGSCLINNTEIWHTNTPNRSESARQLIMLLYKHAWMKSWQEGYELSSEFAARQTDPLRRQLTGNTIWHSGSEHFPAAKILPV